MDSDKTIFITGSTGFIGKNLQNYFNNKYDVINPSHKKLDLLSQKSVSDFFNQNEINYVLHCANFGGSRKHQGNGNVIEKNLRMFFNLAECQDHYERLIHFGSGAEYDKRNNLKEVSEEELGKSIPGDQYGFSKYIISKYIQTNEKMYCLRLFGVFGKYEDYEYRFISNAIIKNLFHLPINIKQNVNYSWLYINDLFQVLDFFISKNPKYSSYNVTPPYTTDLVSVANIINSLSDYESDIIIENEGLNLEYSGSNKLLTKEIEQLEFTPMESALTELMIYYKSILATINSDIIAQDKYASLCDVNPDNR